MPRNRRNQTEPPLQSPRSRTLVSGQVFTGYVAAAIALGIALWFISFLFLQHIYGHPRHAGEAGDAFGAVNALFSAFAIAGIVATLILQNHHNRILLGFELLQYHFGALRGTPSKLHTRFVESLRATASPARVTAAASHVDEMRNQLGAIQDAVGQNLGEFLELIHHAHTTVSVFGLLREIDNRFITLLWAQMTDMELLAVFYYLLAIPRFHDALKQMIAAGFIEQVEEARYLDPSDRSLANVFH